jgi:hypothetical protein
MKSKEILVKPNSTSFNREAVLLLLKTAFESSSFRFARQTVLTWLAAFPGDLEVNVWYARTLAKDGHAKNAASVIEKVLRADPESLQAAQAADEIFTAVNDPQERTARGLVQALGGAPTSAAGLPEWGPKLYLASNALKNKNLDHAAALIYDVLGEASDLALAGVYHLRLTELQGDAQSVQNLARIYHERWPECLQIRFTFAQVLMKLGKDEDAVFMLHQCAVADPAGQVPARIWDVENPYKALYPVKMEIPANFAIPAEIAGKLGFNALGPGTPEAVKEQEGAVTATDARAYDGYKVKIEEDIEDLRSEANSAKAFPAADSVSDSVKEEFVKLAGKLKNPQAVQKDSRFPSYVILSTRKGLENQYGIQSAQVIISEMQKLAASIQKRNGWGSFVFLPDDLEISGRYGVTPVDSIDPWKIKLALGDLDKALGKKGEMIGSVLIVGGDKVVPFHKLPNPTEDDDTEVPSDNPYGTLDTNYFVSDWPVGRLPGEVGSDAGLLLEELRNTLQYHSDEEASGTWLNRLIRLLRFWDKVWAQQFTNTGYTAAVWQRASLAAFRPLGEGRNLNLSPKGKGLEFDLKRTANSPYSYYNLHGVEDGGNWYGQKELSDASGGPDYPIALKAEEVAKLNFYSRIVYTEACYGGKVIDRNELQSMTLAMLGAGALGMVSSTTISYGSVSTPLIGADLLGYLLMRSLEAGMNLGTAFEQAKVDFVKEMNHRQGYLDAEDQKTLISFVLYGDPLVAYDPYAAMKKTVNREKVHVMAKTVSDVMDEESTPVQIPQDVLNRTKDMVKEYLPGIDFAHIQVSRQVLHAASNQHVVPGVHSGRTSKQTNRTVVTFSKQVDTADQSHHQYARVTLDPQGKVVKLAVSR